MSDEFLGCSHFASIKWVQLWKWVHIFCMHLWTLTITIHQVLLNLVEYVVHFLLTNLCFGFFLQSMLRKPRAWRWVWITMHAPPRLQIHPPSSLHLPPAIWHYVKQMMFNVSLTNVSIQSLFSHMEFLSCTMSKKILQSCYMPYLEDMCDFSLKKKRYLFSPPPCNPPKNWKCTWDSCMLLNTLDYQQAFAIFHPLMTTIQKLWPGVLKNCVK